MSTVKFPSDVCLLKTEELFPCPDCEASGLIVRLQECIVCEGTGNFVHPAHSKSDSQSDFHRKSQFVGESKGATTIYPSQHNGPAVEIKYHHGIANITIVTRDGYRTSHASQIADAVYCIVCRGEKRIPSRREQCAACMGNRKIPICLAIAKRADAEYVQRIFDVMEACLEERDDPVMQARGRNLLGVLLNILGECERLGVERLQTLFPVPILEAISKYRLTASIK